MEEVDLLIKHGKILTQNSEDRIINDGIIAINDNTILDLGNFKDMEGLYEGEKRINAQNKLIIPGLVNTHTHLAMNLLRGFGEGVPLQKWLDDYIFPVEEKFVNEEFVYLGSVLAGLESIKYGITSVVDMYYFEDKVAEALKKIGLRGVPSYSILDKSTPDSNNPEEAISNAKNFIKEWKNDELITPGIAPHSIYNTSEDLLLKTKKMSDKFNIPLSIHLAENKREVSEVKDRFGYSPVNYLDKIGILDSNVIAAHCVHVNDEEIKILKNSGTNVAHCPISNLKLSSGISPVGKMSNKGINVSLGTDGSASNNNLNLWEEIKTSILLQNIKCKEHNFNVSDTFFMSTGGGAKSIGLSQELGSLEEGKLADLVVLNSSSLEWFPCYNVKSNLVFSINGCDVEYVIINGKIVYENGEFKTIAKEEIIEKSRRIVEKVESFSGNKKH
ncbi:hypothetical protein AKJ57_00955 [candidate division MSBL1 archaeon SCGC-AAA259A05]|uniref:5-methylthioadenosine/S-adenosylhomocysteine deaminase n=1 Tax=candidate division MSBL1 archaeon SCGC-AAA259A05 TaxID=1698259 RepID=A0A133UBF6_9EURY|nr:hypothetical protein AKJ57_00955 [candidate division MSBL1 archaeon SCGC-AAA259A05]